MAMGYQAHVVLIEREQMFWQGSCPFKADVADVRDMKGSTMASQNNRDKELQQNPVKDPDEWTTGEEPMTGPQESYLRTLLQQAGRPAEDLDESLTKADASKLIDELQQETGRGTDRQE